MDDKYAASSFGFSLVRQNAAISCPLQRVHEEKNYSQSANACLSCRFELAVNQPFLVQCYCVMLGERAFRQFPNMINSKTEAERQRSDYPDSPN